MKKNLQPARTETKTSKTLFGIKTDELKAVHGGSGAVGNITQPAPTGTAG